MLLLPGLDVVSTRRLHVPPARRSTEVHCGVQRTYGGCEVEFDAAGTFCCVECSHQSALHLSISAPVLLFLNLTGQYQLWQMGQLAMHCSQRSMRQCCLLTPSKWVGKRYSGLLRTCQGKLVTEQQKAEMNDLLLYFPLLRCWCDCWAAFPNAGSAAACALAS